MKVTAEGLYRDVTSAKSAFAGDLDHVVRDMLAEEKIICSKERGGCKSSQPTRLTWHRKTRRYQFAITRATLHLFHHRHLISTTLTDEGEEDILPSSLAGRKRRSFSELAQVASSGITIRSAKRPRYIFALFVFAFANPALASLLR